MAINIRDIFDEIGGAAKVARLMNAPVTTVWAWQKSNRIPPARLAHLRLALTANRITCRTLEAGCGQNGPAMAARQVAQKASAKRAGAVGSACTSSDLLEIERVACRERRVR